LNDDLMDFKAHFWGGLLDVLEKGLHEPIVGIAQNADATRAWYDLGDQFEALGCQLRGGAGQPSEIAVRPRKVADQPGRDWIACHHNDGNVARGILRRIDGRGLYRDDDIDLTANQFRGQFGEATNLALRRSDLNLDILRLGIAKIVECFAKRSHRFRTPDEKYADASQPLALLRTRTERPRDRGTANECDEFAPLHALPKGYEKSIVTAQIGMARPQSPTCPFLSHLAASPDAPGVRLPLEADMPLGDQHVSFVPIATDTPQQTVSLFNHLVGTGE